MVGMRSRASGIARRDMPRRIAQERVPIAPSVTDILTQSVTDVLTAPCAAQRRTPNAEHRTLNAECRLARCDMGLPATPLIPFRVFRGHHSLGKRGHLRDHGREAAL